MGVSRRSFIATSTAAAALASKAFAGPFEFGAGDEFPIPADKKFDPAWVASLTARGEPTVYRFKRGSVDELEFIGMPVGGICTGQLYLGGDGKLWHFDIFNQPAGPTWSDTSGPHHAKPPRQASPIEQGFAIRVADGVPRRLDRSGFDTIEFRGTYPIGRVDYRDVDLPVKVSLEAYSPFIPLNEDDSGLPATVLNYTVTNTTSMPLKVEIAGWLQNPVGLASLKERADAGRRANRDGSNDRYGALVCSAHALEAKKPDPGARPPILFEDFEKAAYAESMGGWTPEGTAFGSGPVEVAKRPSYMGELNAQGLRAVNTHVTSSGEDVVKADTHVGTLTSREFTIERRFISLLIGGGNHPGKECVNVLVDGAVVRSVTGKNSNKMRIENIDVGEFEGKRARLQIVDAVTGGWGQVGADDIVFCDEPREPAFVLEEQPDYGTMTLACLGGAEKRFMQVRIDAEKAPRSAFPMAANGDPLVETLQPTGSVGREISLGRGESKTVTFVLAWHFPTPWRDSLAFLADSRKIRRYYASHYHSAQEVLDYVVTHFERLQKTTRLWRDTWYDSTLPYWFLDRTFATACTAATSTCYRFETPSGPRFYGWEGTYCCAGTCTHVWNYGQTLARIFPALERNVRQTIDFDREFDRATGLIHYRGEAARSLAIDGQCGTIMRAYREHTMSRDDSFLRGAWPNIKKAIQLVIDRDENKDGILDGAQYNTLDTTWYGQIAWISSLYLAMLRAGAAMATEMGDHAFAQSCTTLADRGYEQLPKNLFNGEYFVHAVDPKRPEANATGNGCHADMLLGQFFAHQLDLPRIVPAEKCRSSMESLYRYNLAPDAGVYRAFAEKTIKGGRWYAMPGEGGVILCTWPKGGSEAATGKSGDAWAAMYFNECWTGFEHHVAATMIAEGLVEQGMAVERTLHDRHHAAKRSPYNEIECSSHYARAMSAYGAYIAASGYAHHGPSGFLAFDPKVSPENFKAAFTCATGWGSYRQVRDERSQTSTIRAVHGTVELSSLRLGVGDGVRPAGVRVSAGGNAVDGVEWEASEGAVTVRFGDRVRLDPGEELIVTLGL